MRVLGGIELVDDAHARPLGGPTPRLILAVLLAHRRTVVSADLLADAVWGEAPPPTARATLQTHLSKLRRNLDAGGAALTYQPPGYVLEVDRGNVDADRFEDGLGRARRLVDSEPQAAVETLDAALALWRGRAFAEFADTSWARAEAVRLEELRLFALEERVEARLGGGDHVGLIGDLEALVQEHPLRERMWGQLMVALHRSGRQVEALRAAHMLRRQLADEFGVAPSAGLRDLERRIAGDDPSLQLPSLTDRSNPQTQSTPELSPTAGTDLPTSATALVGRALDLDRLQDVLSSSRLLTLTGTGGVGKSRLASELAQRVHDPLHIVELASVRHDEAVIAAVATSLDVEQRPERSLEESVVEVLGPLRLVLLLDNCEHVIDAVGHLVRQIVRWCPGVRMLATSREPIGMAGEVVWPVTPLAVPANAAAPLDEILASPAVQLLASRARDASPAFELTEGTAPAVATLCIQLDGLPLALELAAARMGSMSPRQLADRLHERFELLGSGHAADPRHRTLAAVVQWSYELLSQAEQVLLGRLSVFAGGFELDAAEQACGHGDLARNDVARLVAALVDKSLVVADHGDDHVRYRQLETLRQYGAERLEGRSDVGQVRRSHATTVVAIAERAAVGMEGPDEVRWAAQLDREVDNLRTAVLTAISTGEVDLALRLTAAAREFAFRRIRYEVVGWAGAAAALDGAEDHPLLPTALAIVGYGSFVRGELDRAVDFAERAIAIRARMAVPSCGLPERVLGNCLCYQGDAGTALHWIDGMVTAARASGVPGRVAHALYMRSVAMTSVGDASGAAQVAEEARDAAQQAGSATALSQAMYAAGLACGTTGADEALELLDGAASLAASVGNRWMRAFAMTEAMWFRARRGETASALQGYREVVETWYRGGDWANQWLSLRQLAGILATVGRDDEAALLFGAVAGAGAAAALPIAPTDVDELQEMSAGLERRLGPDAMLLARRRGGAMRDDAVVATALAAIDHVR